MYTKIGSIAAVVAALTATSAMAQTDTTGAYVELRAGVATASDVDLTYYDQGGTFGGTGARDSAAFSADLKSAVAIGGALGYDFGMVRTDLQVDYSRNKVRSLTVKSVNGAPVTLTAADTADICDYLEVANCAVSGNTISFSDGGHVRQLSALANLWLDIPTNSVVTPYVGGGAGVAGYEINGEGKARFAWQLGGGVAVSVSPKVALTVDYRHRQINGTTIEDGPDAGVIIGKVKTNTITGGVRFTF